MDTVNLAVNLEIQEIEIPWCEWELKGKLYAAVPTKSKPRGLPLDEWATALLHAAYNCGKYRLAIPRSLCPANAEKLLEQAKMGEAQWIVMLDIFEGYDTYGGSTPIEAVREIIDSLKNGENILMLSAKKKIPGFIPAILSIISAPEVHIVKVWYPILNKGYDLTPFQIGYLYGLYDDRELKALRERLPCCEV